MISLIPENVVRNDQLMNASATVKKLGDAGQPCLTPRLRMKVSPTVSPTYTFALASKYNIITLRTIEADRKSESTRPRVVRLSASKAPL